MSISVVHRRKATFGMVGRRFGQLVVVDVAPPPAHEPRRDYWTCRCDCGSQRLAQGTRLRNGSCKSCGCLHREAMVRLGAKKATHGMSRSREYKIWSQMKRRCNNPNYHRYHDHGGRGISVCDRWMNDFDIFYADMGPRPSSKHSVERNDNDGNYEPGNCRWATAKEQSANRRPPKRKNHEHEVRP